MHKASFFPLGNADCCRITLSGGERILFDYCHRYNPTDTNDKRIDLAGVLKLDLIAAQRLNFDVVAFTHLDSDHIEGSTSFFHLRHDTAYQSTGRVKIDTLWVPAAAIVEDECEGEAEILQKEARYRLKKKEGIRVFSRPGKLEAWLKKQGMTLDEVRHLITDAGQVVPGWTKAGQGVEFFIHSPFAARMDDGSVVDRNNDALFVQATFTEGGRDTRLILSADVDSDVIEEIVRITRDVKKRPERLGWDINNVPHHTSYKSLNKDEKGTTKTTPPEKVDWLYKQGGSGGYMVSTSDSIPTEDTVQPPHRQAANYYRERVADLSPLSGEYVVTMAHPTTYRPQEMLFEITSSGAKLKKPSTSTGASGITGGSTPRAGYGQA